MKKKLVSVLLSIMFVLSVIPAAAAAETDLPTDENIAETVLPTEETPTEASEELFEETPTVSEIVRNTPAPAGDLPTEPAAEAATEPVDEPAPQPAYPRIIDIYPSAKGVTVCWSAFEGAAKYAVFTKNPDDSWKRLGFTSATSYEHTFTPDGTPFIYTVRAVGENETYISGYDRTGVSFTCLPAPTLTRIDNIVGGQRLIWESVEGNVRYRVYVKAANGWAVVNNTTDTRFINRDAVSGETVAYTVRCMDPVTGKPLSYYDRRGISLTYIAAPEIHDFIPVNGGVTFRWSRVTGAAGYVVFLKENNVWK